jgi:hypothetical protein
MTVATDPNARVVATAGNYLQLIAGFRARLAELEISYATLDALAGWTETYATKLLAEEPERHMGAMAFDAMLGATGLKIALIEDPERLEKVRRHRDFTPRKSRMRATVKHGPYVVQRRTREDMRQMGLEGGRARAAKLSPE